MSNSRADRRTGAYPDQRKTRGSQAEQLAAQYLTEQGYTILERNWRCSSGELDIIACTEHVVVIVEVRSRRAGSFSHGSPIESVTARKIKQVRDTAKVYLYRASRSSAKIRFDVIGIILSPDGSAERMDHIMEAF